MRILRAIVETATDLLAIRIADRFHGIGAQPIGDNLLHDPLEKLQRRGLCQGNAAHCDVSYPIRATEPAVHQGRLQRGSTAPLSTSHVLPATMICCSKATLSCPTPI